MNLPELIGANPVNNATAAALSSVPFWIAWLQNLSEVMALLLPVLGVTWFAIQIYYHIKNKGKK